MPSKRDRRKKAVNQSTSNPLTAQDIANNAYSFLDDAQQEKRIQLSQDGEMAFLGIRMTRTGIQFSEEISEEDYREVGRFLLQIETSIQWLIGDWLAFGEERQWGETYRSVAEEFGYEIATLWDYASVSRQVKTSVRTEELSHAHHRLLRSLTEDEQREWIARAVEGNGEKSWTVAELREAIEQSRRSNEERQRKQHATAFVSRVKNIGRYMTKSDEDIQNLDQETKETLLTEVDETIAQLEEMKRKLSQG